MEDGRYPLSAHVTGVMYKEKNKLYMTSVLWSDQNEIVIYRSFAEYKKMHRQLKKTFPNKLKKSNRVIPRFRDKKLKQSNPKKGPNKTLAYVKFLQAYCTELLSCDPQISQFRDLIKFFQPKDQDLQPEFANNTIMIMPSDEENRNNGGHGNGGNVTQPFVTETYRCVATYETKDTKNKPFKVAVEEKVDVLIKDKAGWWLVEKEDKRMAWFPAPYLEKTDDDGDEDEMDGTLGSGMFYTAVKTYKATKADEITVNIGAVVEVLQKSENGWWLIRSNGKVGYIPTMYLQPYSYPHIRMTPAIQDPRASPTFMATPSNLQQQSQLSRSQGNLMGPPVRSSSPFLLKPQGKQRSLSLDVLSEPPLPPPPPPARSAADNAASVVSTPTSPQQAPLPTIKVEMDQEEAKRDRMVRADSEGSFASDSSDFSLGDDLSSSSASSSFAMSPTANDEQLRFSRTPPPSSSHLLSPTTSMEGRLMPSISDPNLYKGPRSPKVPPRPQAQEILTRCTTITRKNASKSSPSPTETEILGR